MDVIINPKKVTLQNGFAGGYCLGATKNALGNMIAVLEDKFPEINGVSADKYGEMVVSHISEELKAMSTGESVRIHSENLWGINVSVDSAYGAMSFSDYLDGRGKIKLTLQDVVVWRTRHNVKKTVSPLDLLNVNYGAGVRIDDVTSISDILYALLFYYAVNGLNLVKCEHCGRWFATDSFKNKFCNRKSPVPGYDKLNCEQAVQNIRQQCARVRNRIDTKARLTAATGGSPFQDWFWHECNRRTEAIKKQASAERQIEYLSFLKEAENSKAWLDNSCLESVD